MDLTKYNACTGQNAFILGQDHFVFWEKETYFVCNNIQKILSTLLHIFWILCIDLDFH